MTAHRKAHKAAAKKRAHAKQPASRRASAPQHPSRGWPGVVRYALDDWPRTVRLCVIVVVVGAVLLLAMRLGFPFWL